MKKQVSVIIPTYNCANYIEDCLCSIVENDCSRVMIYVIDDGSTDDTSKIMDKYCKEYQFINYFKCKKSGPSVTRNYGLKKVSTKYFTFIDADDFVSNDYFKKIYEIIDDTDADLIHFNKLIREENNSSYILSDKLPIGFVDNIYQNFTKYLIGNLKHEKNKQYSVSLQKNVFKTEILQKHNVNFCENEIYYAEDRLFLLKFLNYVNTLYICDKGYYHYNFRTNSLMNCIDKNKANKISDSYFELLKTVPKMYNESDVLMRLNSYYISRIIYLISSELKQNVDFLKIKSDIDYLFNIKVVIERDYLTFKNYFFIKLIYKKCLRLFKFLLFVDNIFIMLKRKMKEVIKRL